VAGVSDTDRWPARVYAEGEEPDYRFSLANERTFLAWLRTTLALVAAGVAVDFVDLGIDDTVQRGVATLLLGLGVACPPLAFYRWAVSERAMRRDEPLPPIGTSAVVIAGGVLLTAAVLAVLVVGS